MSKKIIISILTILFAIIICGTSSATEWTVGPGGTYDYTTIQSAIDSGTTLTGDTITVYDDNGNPYTYQENVLINKDLTVTTTGQVTVSGSLNPNTPVFTINSAGSQATLSGFSITSATNSAGILINGATDIILNDLTITSCQRGVVTQGTTSNININGANISGTTSNGIYIDSGTTMGLSILNSVISGTGSHGVGKSLNANLDGLTVFNTSVSGSTGYGIYLIDYSGSTYLKNVVIDDVTVSGATSDGIRITMDDTRSGNVTISDSGVSNCYQHGVYLSTRGTLTLSNNTFTHNSYNGGTGGDGQFYGLYLVGTNNSVVSISSDNGFNQNRNGVYLMNLGTVSNPITFNGSLFVDNAGYPFYIYGGRYITIQGGNFDDVSTQASTGYRINRAFYLLGNNNSITIDGVTINHTSSSAIFVDSGTTMGLSILNSVISGTGSHGIFKGLNANLDGLTVFNTSVSGSTGYGIYLIDYSGSTYLKNVVIDDVTVSGATSDGIRITMDDTRSENVTITDSTINNNTQNGIYLQARGTVKVKNNNIHHNTGTGLQLYSSTTEIYGNDITNNGIGLQINSGSNNNNVLNNNFVSNTVQARNYGTNNSFYDDKPIGGNYWSDYTGVDVDRDGFGDTPYNITGITDNYPYIGTIIHVYPGESIQTAINNSLSGYVIIVHGDNGNPATYTENLTIDKHLVIKTTDDGTVTVQAANTGSPVFTINNSGSLTTITGFTITGATGSAGVLIYSANYLNLTNLTIENCQNGVFIRGNSNQITLDELIINSTSQQGIFLEDGYGILSDITISNSQITNSVGTGVEKGYNARINGLSILNTIITNPGPYGLLLTGDGEPITDIVIDNVTVTQADNAGIWIPMGHPESHNIQITNTNSSDNGGNGLTIVGRGIINITSNSFNNNAGWGVSLRGYDNPIVTFNNNQITNNSNGLYVRDISGLVLSDSTNIIHDNGGVVYQLENADSTTIENTSFNNTVRAYTHAVFANNCDNLILRNLNINNSGSVSILLRGNGANTLIDQAVITGSGAQGIFLEDGYGMSNITISNSQITNSVGTGVEKGYNARINGLSILNTIITNPGPYGLLLTGDGEPITDIVIDNVTVTQADNAGIWIPMGHPESHNIQITNTNSSDNGGNGLTIVGRGIINITSNSFNNNAGWGVSLRGYDNPIVTFNNNQITNNSNGLYVRDISGLTVDSTSTVHNNGGTVFELQNADNTTIENTSFNNLVRSYNYAVYANNCDNLTLRNLDISDSGLQSILLTGTGGNVLIDQVDITRPVLQGIYFIEGSLSGIVVSDCVIVDCGASGIEKDYGGTIDGITIENTVITNPNIYGIVLNGYDNFVRHVVIDNNTITGVGDNGVHIRMDNPSNYDVQITNNTITGSDTGITLYGRGIIIVSGNNIQNSTIWGVWMRGFDNPTVTFNNNQITNNSNGLRLQGINGGNFQDNQLINNVGDDLYATTDTNNTFTRLTVGLAHPTLVSFDYINGVIMNGVESPPADIPGLLNIGKYVDMQGFGSTSVNLIVYYSPADIIGLNEASLKIFRYNTAWSVLSSPNGVNTTERYVYADGITSFSTFAAMGGSVDTVYVDGVNGNESNDGFTPLTAKLAINTGIGTASNNWSVYVYPNTTYNENVLVNKDITLEPYGVGNIALNGSITVNIGGSGSTIQGFNVTGSSSAGIILESADNCLITSNTLSGNFMGIYLQNSDNNTISGNIVQNNGWVGICIDNSSNNVVNGGNNINSNVEGVLIANTSTGNTITSNNIHHNTDTGITILNGPTGNIITGNTAISSNNVIGILIRNADLNTISGNIIQSNGWAGISLDQADGNIINGSNTISGNQEGINITNTSSGNTITGNSVTGNTNIGISVINGSNGNFFTGNTTISGNGIIGVYLRDSGSNTISDNIIENNSWVGVCLDNASGNVIDGDNDVTGNLEGLYIVNNSNNNIITGNNIHNNQDTGIYIDGSTGNQINSNTAISSNGVIGILFRNADGNFISANTIANNSFAGVALDNADDNIVNGGNIISGSSMGLYGVNNSSSNTISNNTLLYNIWAGIVLDYTTDNTIYQNNFISNPLQALAQNGSGNAFYQGTTGNYWSDWPSDQPRLIDGNEFLYDQYPSLTPF